MADQEQVDRLKQGVAAWNAWRGRDEWNTHIDLDWADLSEANLVRADLSGADLWKANLSGADLRHADLRRANLGGANLSRANLSRANLHEANFSKANLIEAYFGNADLTDAIRGAFLFGARLGGGKQYCELGSSPRSVVPLAKQADPPVGLG